MQAYGSTPLHNNVAYSAQFLTKKIWVIGAQLCTNLVHSYGPTVHSYFESYSRNKKIWVKITRKHRFSHDIYPYSPPILELGWYTIKLFAKQDSKVVNIFVVNPKISLFENEKKVPHLYSDGSLCLFYPKYNEWS